MRIHWLYAPALAGGCAVIVLSSLNAAEPPTAANKLIIHTDQGKLTINRNIYGHFSEHLGR
jgi:hypothetical protein